MALYFSGDETTERESLLDTITVRAPYMTPLIRQLPHTTIPNRIHEYSIDEPFDQNSNARNISAPHSNTKAEGASFSYRDPSHPVRLRTVAEIQHFGMEMSGTDRTVNLAGVDSSWDYRSGQLFTLLLNSIDNTLMYGQGAPATDGQSGSEERKTQGLIYNAAWTGLERLSGSTEDNISDPYGVSIPSNMWSVFYDAKHKNLTQDMFYNQIMTPSLDAGADWDSAPWIFQIGHRGMARVARFLIADGAIPLNERNRSADDGMGTDFLNYFQFPSGQVVGFRTNRWLSESSSTFGVDNSSYSPAGYTPTTPTSPGTAGARVFYGDQTMIGYEPGTVSICWLREPGFRRVDVDGDSSKVACVAEFALRALHPLCLAGAGNILS